MTRKGHTKEIPRTFLGMTGGESGRPQKKLGQYTRQPRLMFLLVQSETWLYLFFYTSRKQQEEPRLGWAETKTKNLNEMLSLEWVNSPWSRLDKLADRIRGCQGWLRLDIKGNFFMERVVTGQWWRGLKAPWMWHLRTGFGGLGSAEETTGLRAFPTKRIL